MKTYTLDQVQDKLIGKEIKQTLKVITCESNFN